MFLDKRDTQFQPINKFGSKYILIALVGAACLIGTVMYCNSKPSELNDTAAQNFLEHMTHFQEQNTQHLDVLDALIADGEVIKQESAEAVDSLKQLYDHSYKSNRFDILLNGADILRKNVEFGNKIQNNVIKPEIISRKFSDTAKFIAQIAILFPNEYVQATKLRLDLKIHQFELSNLIKDIELLSVTTSNNLKRSFRKLNLRKKYLDKGGLKPSMDTKIFTYQVKGQIADLQASTEKVSNIIEVAENIQISSAKTGDDLENVLTSIQEQLNNQNKTSKKQLVIKENLQGKSQYFYDMKVRISGIEHGTTLVDLAKEQIEKLTDLNYEITGPKSNIAPFDCYDEQNCFFQNADDANKLAESLLEKLEGLDRYCDEVSQSCKVKKAALIKALIFDDISM